MTKKPAPTPALAPRESRFSPWLALVLKLAAFVFAGGVGFFVDLFATLTLLNFGLTPLPARALAIALAIFATYALNRGLTFRREASVGRLATAAESARYATVALATSGLNWLVYAGTLRVAPAIPVATAIVIGSAAALVASYVGYARFAFRGDRSPTTGTQA